MSGLESDSKTYHFPYDHTAAGAAKGTGPESLQEAERFSPRAPRAASQRPKGRLLAGGGGSRAELHAHQGPFTCVFPTPGFPIHVLFDKHVLLHEVERK